MPHRHAAKTSIRDVRLTVGNLVEAVTTKFRQRIQPEPLDTPSAMADEYVSLNRVPTRVGVGSEDLLARIAMRRREVAAGRVDERLRVVTGVL